jgi:hypothetical protein
MLSFLNQFKHGQEMRESKDEILVGELVRAMARLKTPAIGFNANSGAQMIHFKPIGDPVLHSIVIIVDRKTGGSMIQQAVIGSKATIQIQAEVKNYLSDPDDLVAMYRTDLANIFKMPMLGDVKLDHQMNSVFATKRVMIDIDDYILKGEESISRMTHLITSIVGELKQKLTQYKKA